PEELIVYGGSGKAARDWESFHRIVETLRELENDETLLIQSGEPPSAARRTPRSAAGARSDKAWRSTGLASQLADQHLRNGQPRRVVDHDLALPDPRRQHADELALAVDQSPECESPAGARHERVAVDQPGRFLGPVLAQPKLVAAAVLALRRVDREAQQRTVTAEIDRQDRVARGGQRLGAVLRQARDDLRLGVGFALDQQLGIDPERGGDAVHPREREVAHPGFEPADGLRGSRRVAGRGDLGQRHALLPADVADAVDHGAGPSITDLVFALSYNRSLLASPAITSKGAIRMQRKLVERELTPEGPRRRGGVAPRRRSVTVNLAESPLSWLHAHGHLDERLFLAGERLP